MMSKLILIESRFQKSINNFEESKTPLGKDELSSQNPHLKSSSTSTNKKSLSKNSGSNGSKNSGWESYTVKNSDVKYYSNLKFLHFS